MRILQEGHIPENSLNDKDDQRTKEETFGKPEQKTGKGVDPLGDAQFLEKAAQKVSDQGNCEHHTEENKDIGDNDAQTVICDELHVRRDLEMERVRRREAADQSDDAGDFKDETIFQATQREKDEEKDNDEIKNITAHSALNLRNCSIKAI